MPPIAVANAVFPLGLAAAIGIERSDWILLDVRCALSPIEHVVGRNMDQRDSTLPGFHCNPGGRLGVDGKSQRFVRSRRRSTFGISGRVDDDVPWPRPTARPICLAVGQIKFGMPRRDNIDAGVSRNRADLCRRPGQFRQKEERAFVMHSSPTGRGGWRRHVSLKAAATRRDCRCTTCTVARSPEFKCVPRLPAELGLELRTIDRVTEIVAGTVGDKGDQFAMRFAVARFGASLSIVSQIKLTTSILRRSLSPPIL